MYAFRQALPQGLNDKLIGVTPAPKTLTELVEKAQEFDQQWQQWRAPQNNYSSNKPRGPRVRSNATDEPSINLADTNVQSTKFKRLTKEERQQRIQIGACLYCGEVGHFAKECRKKSKRPQWKERPPNKFVKNRALETGEEAPSAEPSDAAVVSRIYQDPSFHFVVPDTQPVEPTEDF
jgi:hypothetical protein